MVFLVVITAAASLRKLIGAKLNVPIFIEFNNYRESKTNVTFSCVNQITGGRIWERSIMTLTRLAFTVAPDPKFHVYTEMSCCFYNTTTDDACLVAIDPYAGMGPNVDSSVLQYEWNIWDSCFDLIRHYVNGTKLIPRWPRD